MSSFYVDIDSTPINNEEERELLLEITDLLYATIRRTTLISLTVATSLVIALYRVVSNNTLLAWVLIFIAIYSSREVLAFAYQNRSSTKFEKIWLVLYRVTCTLCGLIWGAVGYFFYPVVNSSGQAFLVVTLIGVSSGATINYLADAISGRLFCLSLYVFAMQGFIQHGTSFSFSLAVTLAFFFAYTTLASITVYRSLRDNIRLRIVANERAKATYEMTQRQNLHFEQTPMGVIECNDKYEVIAWNAAAEKMFGYSKEEAIGRHLAFLISASGKESATKIMEGLFKNGLAQNNQSENIRKDGEIIFCDWFATPLKDLNGRVTAAAALIVDRTESQNNLKAIHELAYFDVLTKLPNRSLLIDRMGQALAKSRQNKLYGAIIFLDLDRFKTINDIKGHAAGDYLLIQVAQRLLQTVQEYGTVARFGGDEFVIVLEEVGSQLQDAIQASKNIAKKVIEVINRPFEMDGYVYQTSPSLGICLFQGDVLDVSELLKRADIAMFQAKQAGRNTMFYFDEYLQPQIEARAELEADLRNALILSEFLLYYQLQVNHFGEPLGAELLLRWKHPIRGWVLPSEFIPIAEESNLICEIGNWVLMMACLQIQIWQKNIAMKRLRLSVNISARQFEQPDFVEQVLRLINEYKISPQLLRLELTEGLMLKKSDEVIEKLVQLKKNGLSLSIDDFGTGYSSLAVLKHFPLNELKIDRSFVADVPDNPDDAVLIKTIVSMGNNLGLEVIAEGVETLEQFNFLKQTGCYAYQGYLFGRPMAINDFETELTEYVDREVASQ